MNFLCKPKLPWFFDLPTTAETSYLCIYSCPIATSHINVLAYLLWTHWTNHGGIKYCYIASMGQTFTKVKLQTCPWKWRTEQWTVFYKNLHSPEREILGMKNIIQCEFSRSQCDTAVTPGLSSGYSSIRNDSIPLQSRLHHPHRISDDKYYNQSL